MSDIVWHTLIRPDSAGADDTYDLLWEIADRRSLVWDTLPKYSQDQPRVPAGQPGGGQFGSTGEGQSVEGPLTAEETAARADQKLDAEAAAGIAACEKLLPQAMAEGFIHFESDDDGDDDEPGEWESLKDDVQVDAADKYIDNAIENMEGDSSIYDSVREDVESDIRRDGDFDDSVKEEFVTVAAVALKLDPDSITVTTYSGSNTELDDLTKLQHVDGTPLTEAERSSAITLWDKTYQRMFDHEVETRMENEQDHISELEMQAANDSASESWHSMSDSEKYSFAQNEGLVTEESHLPPIPGLPNEWKTGIEDENRRGQDYLRTQAIARKMVELRTVELLTERGLLPPAITGHPSRELATDHAHEIARDVWSNWKSSSTSPEGLALQLAASKELDGINRLTAKEQETAMAGAWDVAGYQPPYTGQSMVDRPKAEREADGMARLQAYVRAQWETTQFVMAKAGENHAQLYRALMLPKGDVDAATKETVKVGDYAEYTRLTDLNLLRSGAQSTTSDRGVANGWNGNNSLSYKGAQTRVVLRLDVPRTAVLSVPVFGKNVHEERESVLVGTRSKWQWDAFAGKAPTLDRAGEGFSYVPIKKRAAGRLTIDLLDIERGRPHWLSWRQSPEIERRNERLGLGDWKPLRQNAPARPKRGRAVRKSLPEASRIAARQEPALGRALLGVWRAHAGGVDMDALRAALSHGGDAGAVVGLLRPTALGTAQSAALRPALLSAIQAGIKLGAVPLARVGVHVRGKGVGEPPARWDPSEHPRDEHGQFAETGDENAPGLDVGQFFHGTSQAQLDNIIKSGLTTDHSGLVWPTYSERGYVYLTDEFGQAREFAEAAALKELNNDVWEDQQVDVGVIKVEVPASVAREPDPNLAGTGAIRLKQDIPPEWIVAAYIARTGQGSEPTHWHRVKAANTTGARVYYVPIVFGRDGAKAFGDFFREEDHPRAPAGGPDGGQFVSSGGGTITTTSEAPDLASVAVSMDRLSADELQAMHEYVENGQYHKINGLLRTGEPIAVDHDPAQTRTTIEALDRAIQHGNFDEETTLYRGVGGHHGITTSMKAGDSFTDDGFVSMSSLKESAQRFAADHQGLVVQVQVPKGTPILHVAAQPGDRDPDNPRSFENELILPRGTQFTVVHHDDRAFVVRVTHTRPVKMRKPKAPLLSAEEIVASQDDLIRFGWADGDQVRFAKEPAKGGAGSGNFGHEGRPGQVGGSGAGAAVLERGTLEERQVAFREAFEAAFRNNPRTAMVSHYTQEEIAAGHMEPLTSHGGKTGLLVHDHGDGRIEATALYNTSGVRGAGLDLLQESIDHHGVNYVECYGPKLPQLYATLGFETTDKFPFDRSLAAPTWNYAQDGEPDYHIMHLKGGRDGSGKAATGHRSEGRQDFDAGAEGRRMGGGAGADRRTAGRTTAKQGLVLDLDLLNPEAVTAAALRAADLVEAPAAVKTRIRALVRRSIAKGIPPDELARLIRSEIGLDERRADAVEHYQARLENSGVDPETRAVRTERFADRQLRDRASTIARTELIGALNDGQQMLWDEAIDEGVLEKDQFQREWIITDDEKLCPICEENAEAPVDMDEEFPSGDMTPPAHPNCRCAMGLVNATKSARKEFDESHHPRVPAGEHGGGQFTSGETSGEGTAAPGVGTTGRDADNPDLVPDENDLPIINAAQVAKEWDDLPYGDQRNAEMLWAEDTQDAHDQLQDDVFSELSAEIRQELVDDDEAVINEAAIALANDLTREEVLTEPAPLLENAGITETHHRLDPDSVVYDTDNRDSRGAPSIDPAELRTMTGAPLTPEQQQLVVGRWSDAYHEVFEDKLNEKLTDDDFSERQNEAVNNALEREWNHMSDAERMEYVDERVKGGDDRSPAQVFKEASELLGVNAEALTTGVSRVAREFMPEGSVVDVKIDLDEFKINVQGPGTKFEQTFTRTETGQLNDHIDYFVLPNSAQGKGMATQALADSMKVFDRYNVTRIDLQANIDVGGYAWGKMGFEQTNESFTTALEMRGQGTGRGGSVRIDPDVMERALKIANEAGRGAPKAVADMPEGKKLMLGLNWFAQLNLRDNAGVAFRARLMAKSKQKKK